jgi:hypothetical protein
MTAPLQLSMFPKPPPPAFACRFYLGTHRPDWLGRIDTPLFISRRQLGKMRALPRARARWALDSGGFTELNKAGRWTLSAADYVAEVRRFRDEVGLLQWAAIQDWMCEPFVLEKTRLTVAEHQRRTIASALELRELAPEIPWCPVLQGWEFDDYQRHADAYEAAGFSLAGLPIVGVGSVCRRQHSAEAEAIFRALSARGIALHGFGLKQKGLARSARYLASADSLAWSYSARRNPEPGGCPHRAPRMVGRRLVHAKNCANCSGYALEWRERVLAGCKGVS